MKGRSVNVGEGGKQRERGRWDKIGETRGEVASGQRRGSKVH